MPTDIPHRRHVLMTAGSMVAVAGSGLWLPVAAQGVAPTRTMAGGANNYRPGAPIVERIGPGGASG